jgi:8-oxo-dGTP diphosphatase
MVGEKCVMSKIEIATMVMIEDKQTDKVLVLNRARRWKGISFPGGHIEDNESFYDCAVREIKEETGLHVFDLKSCGVIHWSNNKTFDRYLIFLYKTSKYSGELLPETDEGKISWMSISEIKALPTSMKANNIDEFLPMFIEDKYCEVFGSWNDDDPWEIMYYK